MTARTQLVINYAVEFLRLDAEYTAAKGRNRFYIGEERETARRALADMIIAADPSKTDEMRKAVIHPLPEGARLDFHARLTQMPACARGGVYGGKEEPPCGHPSLLPGNICSSCGSFVPPDEAQPGLKGERRRWDEAFERVSQPPVTK